MSLQSYWMQRALRAWAIPPVAVHWYIFRFRLQNERLGIRDDMQSCDLPNFADKGVPACMLPTYENVETVPREWSKTYPQDVDNNARIPICHVCNAHWLDFVNKHGIAMYKHGYIIP